MKIFTVPQIRALDAYTIQHEPISSLDLMERASQAFVDWFCARFNSRQPVLVFCGMGNNGGDGLAIARLLSERAYAVQVYVVEHAKQGSEDFQANLDRLPASITRQTIIEPGDIPSLPVDSLVIDALLGSGLTRSLSGLVAEVVKAINQSQATILSVDIATGLYADQANQKDDTIIQPEYTVTFQLPKLAFMMPRNEVYVGEWVAVDIGLSREFIEQEPTPYAYTDEAAAQSLIMPRGKFSHKGTFGHALLIAGSFGKMGAALLCGRACLRSGIGLLTMHIPRCGYTVIQTAVPEAMALVDLHEQYITTLPSLQSYDAIGMGPGIGKDPQTLQALKELITRSNIPLVLDADALNLLAENPDLLEQLPENTILTPHPREFQRLTGESPDEFQRLQTARDFCARYNVIVCLKGAHTAVVLPDGQVYFNSTGNAGMATGGTGDVLTGIITSLVAQGYIPAQAAQLGVYQHGAAGDKAARSRTKVGMIASDIVENLGW
ncbi:NAD(P)H-hydrate dehydratase [Telluribacter sp. SYSU D00476]|uniref:NAD(P)H-hydrate dehydratase n=1 Tax=Telluribacter sp. SYSU D00476 TaxID=2811430 RepID=UPI001FF3AE56|nr:NAD(P)H-hydrate dehydratase [Telluribacter sp. SYSU D00476]